MNKKTAAITGASGGIGSALAKLLSREYTVYNLSRRSSCAEGVCNIKTDVSDEISVKTAFEEIKLKEGKLDLLVNCAGYGISGAIEFTNLSDAKSIFDVNFYGTFLTAKYALPLLRNTHGRIINVSSEAARFSIPYQGFYSASKSAVNSLTLCLANEAARFGVSVCAVTPGDVKTGFTAARIKNDDGESLYGGTIQKSVAVMEHDEKNGEAPEDIAAFIKKIAEKKKVKPLYTSGLKYKFFDFLFKVLPCRTVNKLVGMLYIKK